MDAIHKARHEMLHTALDELFADYIGHHPNRVGYLTLTIDELLKWSYEQTINPTEEVQP
jgi:hypothetical protein